MKEALKNVLKIILMALLLMQVVTPIILLFPSLALGLAIPRIGDSSVVKVWTICLGQLLATGFVLYYLWKKKYISKELETWSPISVPYLLGCVLALICSSWLVNVLTEQLTFLPDIMSESIQGLVSNVLGITAIAFLGPVMEELLFRGTVTKLLLSEYSPWKAILISSALFAVFHLNPIQMPAAFLIGLLFAWTYYKTGSLFPCILMHILNNSIATVLGNYYPEDYKLNMIFSTSWIVAITITAVLVLMITLWWLNKTTIEMKWKTEEQDLTI